MPGSLARKERRRKEREGMRSPVASKAAHVEGVDDDGEPHGGAVQATEDKPADGNEDIPSLVHAREPPKGSQSRPQGPVRPPPTSLGEVPHSKDQAGQKQSKNRSKRGPPPRIPRESEPPFGSLRNAPSSIYEEAIDTLRKMSPADTARLKNVVLNQMAAEGFPMPTEDPRPKRMQGTSYPMRSIVNPPWVPSMRKKDIMTEGEAENLRRALLDKIDKSVEQDWAAPIAKALEELKSQKSATTLQTIGGNVDGASQSVEIVAPEKEAATGKQATIVQPKKEEGPETVRPLLATDCENKLTSLPHDEHLTSLAKSIDQKALDEGIINTEPEDIEKAIDVVTREQITKASTASENDHPVAGPVNHSECVARVDDMAKRLRQSVEKARTEIRPDREGVTLDRGFTQNSSSSDYASSLDDSGSKAIASRTRRITNDGILELKASPFKVGPVKIPLKDHRRKVSLKLPINVSTPQRAHVRPITNHTHSTSVSTDESVASPYEAEERELEYKHRHIFVGTASLDDFLEILEVTPTYTTTKRQVVKAFGILACAEQVHARQSSISSDGWNFVTRTTHDDILTHTDYLTEAQVKLGSISLGKFLAKIPFDFKGDVAATKVVEAFCLASHLDGEATCGAQSKAKAFRSWYVRGSAAK